METIARITIRCFFLGMVFVLLWFFLYAVAEEQIHEVHSTWFDLTRHELAVIHYSGMMALKAFCFLFFLAPYIACKWCGGK
ncbi:MAG: hypothetical protein JSW66_03265 [Phycisphaerales bacterium]|nr:MAG: hypothetical protein JSW66_03265 [Phycisphaerales bacterium]